MFKVGDQVVCVNDETVKDFVTKGSIYTIARIDSSGGVALVGVSHAGFFDHRFLPAESQDGVQLSKPALTPPVVDPPVVDWESKYRETYKRLSVISDSCGTLATERDELLRENAILRRKLERATRLPTGSHTGSK